jgi:hypothetical protein
MISLVMMADVLMLHGHVMEWLIVQMALMKMKICVVILHVKT